MYQMLNIGTKKSCSLWGECSDLVMSERAPSTLLENLITSHGSGHIHSSVQKWLHGRLLWAMFPQWRWALMQAMQQWGGEEVNHTSLRRRSPEGDCDLWKRWRILEPKKSPGTWVLIPCSREGKKIIHALSQQFSDYKETVQTRGSHS